MAASKAALFLAGAGAVVALAVIYRAVSGDALQPRPVVALQAQPALGSATAPAAPAPVRAATQEAACPAEPMVQAASEADGRFAADPSIALRDGLPARAFVAAARDAAGQGLPRDAEVALLVACVLTARQAPGPTVALADVQQQLGGHYAALARSTRDEAAASALLARANQVLSSSAATYTRVLGADASKSRLAARRLQSVARGEPVPNPLAADSARAATGADTGAAVDIDFAQLESDLRRLQAQVAAVSSDPAGLRRRSEAALARKQACTSQACVAQWYAQRRRELLDEF